MTYLSKTEKRILPEMKRGDSYREPAPSDHVIMGKVEIDNSACNGCELCVECCPANALVMTGDKSVAMAGEGAGCIACGACVAICLPRIIKITRFQEYDGLYRFIGRGVASTPRCF